MTKKQKEDFNAMLSTLKSIAGYMSVAKLTEACKRGKSQIEEFSKAYDNMKAEANVIKKRKIKAIK